MKVFEIILKIANALGKVFFPKNKKKKKKKKKQSSPDEEYTDEDNDLVPLTPPPIVLCPLDRRNRGNADRFGYTAYPTLLRASSTLTGYTLIIIGLTQWLLKVLK